MRRILSSSIFSILFLLALAPAAYAQHHSSRGLEDFFKDKLYPRKPVEVSRMGINAFVNDNRFGSIESQFLEVRDTLGIKQVRVLFAWLDEIQPTPSSTPNFSFYDDIVNSLPEGVEAVAVLTELPSWMKDSSNWISGDPRKTFIEKWVHVVAARYKNNPKLRAIQVWNEPNMTSNPDNSTLGVATSPENYVSMLKLGRSAIRSAAPGKLVINAATTAINQNYPRSLSYNRKMRAAKAESYVDAWAIHYYGSQAENIIRPGGIESFLRGIKKPIWVTESGAKGTNKQLEYVERYWTFLRKRIPRISRIYLYQFTEATPASTTYGLKNLTDGQTTSDLYNHLRDRKSSSTARRR